MTNGSKFERTLGDTDLATLPDIDGPARSWGADLPVVLASALSCLSSLDALEAEEMLTPLLAEHVEGPEIWWGLAVAMVGQKDFKNASTCYENFRDRLEIEVALALHECGSAPEAACRRLRRLTPSLVRCRDSLLAVRGLIMASGLELLFEEAEEAAWLLRETRDRIRSIWPRPWGLVAEWLATVAVASAQMTDGRRPERSFRLALRFARREPDNPERIATIGRDLGLLLNHADRIVEAESTLAAAMAVAAGGASTALQTSITIAQAQNLRGQRRYVEAIALLDHALASDVPDQLRALALMATSDIMLRLGSHHRDRSQLANAGAAATEAASLLQQAGVDATAAIRDRGVIAAMLGDTATARKIAFALLRSATGNPLPPSERVALAYLLYLIRLNEGRPRKALSWAEYGLRTALRARIDRPRDLLLQREHCIAAAERLNDIITVRRHAIAMLDAEAEMLRVALGDGRGPADWNRLRVAREGLSILATMEGRSNDPGAAWRQAEALLAGRGLARAARRSLRRNCDVTGPASVREFARRLAPGEVLLALVSMHPPAPVDPAFPWASGFTAPRLIGILIAGAEQEPAIEELGDFADCANAVRRWTRNLAVGRIRPRPGFLDALERWLRDVRTVFVVAEGAMELLPLRLLTARSVIRQISGVRGGRDRAESTAPVVLAASDMLEAPFGSATEREVDLVCAALGDVRRFVVGDVGSAEALELLALAPRHIHIVAHGAAVLDPRDTELDVYQGAALELGSQILTASAVADLHLEGVELVILSSCDTSKGAAQHAEGLASMAAAFLDAGAAVAIATLWPVPHEETAAFMALLYAQDLRDPARALTQAQGRAQAIGMEMSCWAAWVALEAGLGTGSQVAADQSTTA